MPAEPQGFGQTSISWRDQGITGRVQGGALGDTAPDASHPSLLLGSPEPSPDLVIESSLSHFADDA